jgi:hypothetical protein
MLAMLAGFHFWPCWLGGYDLYDGWFVMLPKMAGYFF